jgi:hypothetical protein
MSLIEKEFKMASIKSRLLWFLIFLVSLLPSAQAASEAKTIKTNPAQIRMLAVNSNQVVNKPAALSCLTASISLGSPTNIWYTSAKFSVTNNCSSSQNLNNAVVSFQSNSSNVEAMWGGVNSSSAFTYQGSIASTVLNIQSGKLNIGKTLVLNFGINLSGSPFDLNSANNTLAVVPSSPTPTNGEIDVTVDPTGMSGVTSPAQINVTGPGLSSPYVITNTSWNSPTVYKITGLAYGTYTISPQPIGSTYVGIAMPATVSVNSSTPVTSTVTYQPAPAVGSLQISLGAAPMTGLASSVTATLTDNTSHQSQNITINWGGMQLIQNLTAGDNFTLTFPQVTNGLLYSNMVPLSGAIVISQGRTTPLTISYQAPQQVPSQSVQFTLSGLPAGVQGSLQIVDAFGNTFNQSNLNNGQVSQALPVNDTFSVSASAPGLSATVSPASFTLQSGTIPPAVSVTFSAVPPPASASNFYAYADTGIQSSGNGFVPPKGANLVEAFILWNATEGKADLWAITEGDQYSQIIKNTPNTVASVGGANAPYPWDYESIDQGVADISALIKYYGFIGIDFDVEGAALEESNAQNWVANVAFKLRQAYPNLILTLTVPDPVASGDATYPGLPVGAPVILKQTLALNNNKMVFNWVNKMDFDEDGINVGCTQTSTNMSTNCLVISGTAGAQSLASLLNISTQQAYQYLGEIFMIPTDDQGHALSLSLANQVATTLYNQGKGVTHMGYWSLQRDDTNLDYGNQFTHILGLS